MPPRKLDPTAFTNREEAMAYTEGYEAAIEVAQQNNPSLKQTKNKPPSGKSKGVIGATSFTNGNESLARATGYEAGMEAAQQNTPSLKQTKNKPPSGKNDGEALSIEDLLLPRSLTSRLARGVLPPNTSIQKDAILALTKSATVFISYLAHTANEMTDRKTIQAADVLKAVQEIEMDGVMGLGVIGRDGRIGGRLEREVAVYEEGVKGKRKGYREKVKARESGAGGSTVGAGGMASIDDMDDERGHEAKRIRRTSGAEIDEDDADVDLQADVDANQTAARASLSSPSKKISATPSALNGTLSAADEDGNDQTETDAENGDEEEDEDENEEDDEGDEDEDEEDETQQDLEDGTTDLDERDGRKNALLAPNGRVEVGGSDDESD